MAVPFDTDASGNIITCPLMGWDAAVVAETAMLLRLRYATEKEDLKTGGHALQLVLTPQQCLSLSDLLRKHAEFVLAQKPGSPRN